MKVQLTGTGPEIFRAFSALDCRFFVLDQVSIETLPDGMLTAELKFSTR